ncbi:hypothetical protein [Stutzerimonas degradans]
MRPQDFYTRTRASEGVRIEFVDPSGNREWIRVRSVVSDEFRAAAEAAVIQAARSGDEPAKQKARKLRAELAASLIAGWSLPADIDQTQLLVSAPRLRRQIERIAENHSLHFGVSHD